MLLHYPDPDDDSLGGDLVRTARIVAVFSLLAVAAPIAYHVIASTGSGRVAVAAPSYWPTNGWRESSPEQQGLDSHKLAAALEEIREKRLPVHSVLVIRNGYIVLDASFFPYEQSTPHDIASCTKSVTTTLVGVAIQDKKIHGTDDLVLRYFPESHPKNLDEGKSRMTIADVLSMRSGLQCEYKGGEPTLQEMRSTSDWAQFMLDRPMAHAPGKEFVYCSGGMHLLSSIIVRATGSASTEQYANEHLFGPLGIGEHIWPADPQGVNYGWGDLHLSPKDLAKIGFLYLHDGMWDGKRILPEQFVSDATSPLTKTPFGDDYGFGWWISPTQHANEFMAVGRGGQRMTVLRRFNAIIVVTGGGDFDPGKDVNPALGHAVVSDHAVPENPAALAELRAEIAKVEKSPDSPSPVPALPVIAQQVSGLVYQMEPNPMGLSRLQVDLRSAPPLLSLVFQDGRKEQHEIGLDGVFRISNGGFLGLPVAARARWEGADTLALEYDTIANINAYKLRLTFKANDLAVEAMEATRSAKVVFQGHVLPAGKEH